jgi:alpha-1,2-mannosyltransferase
MIEQVLERSRHRRSNENWSGSPADRPLLSRQRAILLCGILLAVEIAFFAFFAAGTHGLIVPLKRPTSTDFVSFYAAGSLANTDTASLAYNQAEHYAAEERATALGITYNFFYYPPTFLLLCAALAHLPYILAFIGFEVATLGFYGLVVRRILDDHGWGVLLPILAFPPVLWTIGLGQNGFLTAGLFGGATLLVDRRPFAAGLLFGGLCCKPHFAMLVPVALFAGGCWRALLGALISAGGLCLLSVIAFGAQTWHDFFVAAAGSSQVYASGRISFGGFITPFGAALLLGAPPGAAAVVQAAAAAIAAIFVAIVWRRNLPLPIRAASLISATLVAVPLALFYDLVLAGVAAAWLLRGDGEHRLSEPATLLLAGLYVLCLNPRGIAADWHIPIGMLIVVALTMLTAAVAARRALWDPAPITVGG